MRRREDSLTEVSQRIAYSLEGDLTIEAMRYFVFFPSSESILGAHINLLDGGYKLDFDDNNGAQIEKKNAELNPYA